MLHHLMFPHLHPAKWAEVNLNAEAIKLTRLMSADTEDDLSFVDPATQIKMMHRLHRNLGVDCSYGGYLEDRSTLWAGHYMAPDRMVHLGVDYNVPFGVEVKLPFDGRSVFAVNDKDQNGGWGRRVDYYNEKGNFYFILGHLMPVMQWFQLPVEFKKGSGCGHVGHWAVNGGWYPHLHLQCVTAAEYRSYSDPMMIDGYGGGDLAARYLNPETVKAGTAI